jgi:hypothetical protein
MNIIKLSLFVTILFPMHKGGIYQFLSGQFTKVEEHSEKWSKSAVSFLTFFLNFPLLYFGYSKSTGRKNDRSYLCAMQIVRKRKINGKKLSQFQFHFPGHLGTSPMSKQETKKIL